MSNPTRKLASHVRTHNTAASLAARCLGALLRAIKLPMRVLKERRELQKMAGMSERELRDIGLCRHDVQTAAQLPMTAEPTMFLADRAKDRQRKRIP